MTRTDTFTPDMLKIFEAVPDSYLLLSPDLLILSASNAYLSATQTVRQELTGKSISEVFSTDTYTHSINLIGELNFSLQDVLATGKPHQITLPQYDLPLLVSSGSEFKATYWNISNLPVS